MLIDYMMETYIKLIFNIVNMKILLVYNCAFIVLIINNGGGLLM